MTFFAVQYTYTSDADRIDELRPQHREYLKGLVAQGSLRASGPFVGADPAAALLVFSTDSIAQVRSMLDKDPFQIEGLVAETTIHEWDPVLGDYASRAG